MADPEQCPRPVLLRLILSRLIRLGLWGWGRLGGAAYSWDAVTLEKNEHVNTNAGPIAMICTHICANSSSPRRATLNISVDTQTFLGKAVPYVTEVLPACEDLIRLDDRIARVKETGTTRLQFHGVQHELYNERISVLRNKWPWSVRGRELRHAVEVTERNRAIFERSRWEEGLDEAVLLNQALGNNPKNLRPDLADSVNPPVLGPIERLVRGRINRIILKSGQEWITGEIRGENRTRE